MDKFQVILFVFAFTFAGFRLYQRYIKKNGNKPASGKGGTTVTGFTHSSKDDDYEPYSKK